MEQFKCIRELGLTVNTYDYGWQSPVRSGVSQGAGGAGGRDTFVRAAELEALLEKAVRVYGWSGECWNEDVDMRDSKSKETHTALLIGIRPIERDSAKEIEKLIKEALKHYKTFQGIFGDDWLERARKLIGESK